jgi:hypothetical protein
MNRSDRRDGREQGAISNELATAINDGLYFYEQVDIDIVCIFMGAKRNMGKREFIFREINCLQEYYPVYPFLSGVEWLLPSFQSAGATK